MEQWAETPRGTRPGPKGRGVFTAAAVVASAQSRSGSRERGIENGHRIRGRGGHRRTNDSAGGVRRAEAASGHRCARRAGKRTPSADSAGAGRSPEAAPSRGRWLWRGPVTRSSWNPAGGSFACSPACFKWEILTMFTARRKAPMEARVVETRNKRDN